MWKLLDTVPEDERRELLALARRRTFDRDEVVFHRGDPADTLHLVSRGHFATRVTTQLGESVTLAIEGPGEIFGELALVSPDGKRSATIAALEPGETRVIHRSDFERLRRRYPGLNDVLVALLAAQLRRSSDRLVEALYLPAEARVLRRLAELAAIYSAEPGGPVVPLTQEQLAELAGTSRATANRVLRDESRRGTLTLGRGQIVVVDREQLARRAARRDF